MKKKYKILITVSEFVYSSQVRNLCDLVSLLDKDIFDVEIGALEVGDPATREVEKLGVPYYRLRLIPTRNMDRRRMLDFIKGPFIIPWKKYDLVHSLLYQCFFTEPFLIKALTRAKYIYTKSNLDWDNHPWNWKVKSQYTDKIISISHATDELLKEKGFENKIEKIFLGIDTNAFTYSESKRVDVRKKYGISDDAFVFGCAAQFIPLKDHQSVIEAFEIVSSQHKNIYLFFCGPNHNDAYYQSILDKISKSKVKDKIVLLGILKDMTSFYSAIDCFALASLFETFGYVYVEAMSCKRPTIASRADGPLEIINEGETGFFVEKSNPIDMAEKMDFYLNNRDLVDKHGEQARVRVKECFSKEAMAKNTQKLYLELLEGNKN